MAPSVPFFRDRDEVVLDEGRVVRYARGRGYYAWPLAPRPALGPFSVYHSAYRDAAVADPGRINKLEILGAPDYGLEIMGAFSEGVPAPSPGPFLVSDIIAQRIGHTPPTSNGTAEAGIWLGAQANARRLVASGTWDGIWTGCQCRSSVVADFTVGQADGQGGYTLPVPHVGVYCEHFTRHTIFTRGTIRAESYGGVNEWWYPDPAYAAYVAAEYPQALSGKAGSCFNVYDNLLIYCPPGGWGWFADAGTWGCRWQNCLFYGPGNGISLPSNLAGPVGNAVEHCVFHNAGSHISFNDNPIG